MLSEENFFYPADVALKVKLNELIIPVPGAFLGMVRLMARFAASLVLSGIKG